ncbi:alpha/beta fold hydrolase [Algoriphagus litoralis]|uniref:alpha/beta fold hydrolase n=1 Tax=Algoriphagus litoralis TaxID=2202829 RepID=UPI000DBAC238|nr:alpha/beta hydrolase [Algoriphagus litoralis]
MNFRYFLLLILILLNGKLLAQTAPEPARELIHELRKIHTPNGIEVLEEIELNGSKQWISIRGKDKSNPVLLFLHGGPASPNMPLTWVYQSSWEEYFTVVQWDQRGTGKNWASADTTKLAEELSFRALIQDAYLLVDHLRERFQQDKIFLMGYSYGAGIGIRMAARIPQKLHAYIGVGQMAPGNPEQIIYEKVLRLAEESNNQTALEELKALAPYPAADGSTPIRKLLTVRKWSRQFNGGWYGKPDFNLLFSLPSLAPEYTPADIQNLETSSPWISRKILAKGGGGDFPMEFQIPIIFMMGRHDLHTPYQAVEAYFSQLSSPGKNLITFEYSGHVPFLEEPGRFFLELVTTLRPIAGATTKAP